MACWTSRLPIFLDENYLEIGHRPVSPALSVCGFAPICDCRPFVGEADGRRNEPAAAAKSHWSSSRGICGAFDGEVMARAMVRE